MSCKKSLFDPDCCEVTSQDACFLSTDYNRRHSVPAQHAWRRKNVGV